MWTWPLDSAIGATTTHIASEGVADRTCTQVWAWMTNKCRKMMNQRKGYIIGEISHKGGARGSETRREFIFSDEESFPLGRWAVWFCSYLLLDHPQFLHKPLPHQSPTFGPSLQIHCTGSAGPRFPSVTRPNQKTVTLRIYIYLLKITVYK